ncbi:ABC transporter substrate-binding protein [Thiomicrorhabdus sp. ZW0627]|uniref:MlaC/ttg2D family ABC transporter substrate-binding protein n=1 Tax=Thiomicrorhabdus sp. ZW0627 TaxID=3039774 RepID=UPI0024370876|nr:ABC transporter substrate-binding protein [Thiomicrorhabdus sp. ZW0627]MDG6773574.1 ABC transporter substrate-binding protein [Thiomicrorhabdus sp. ZW0627]
MCRSGILRFRELLIQSIVGLTLMFGLTAYSQAEGAIPQDDPEIMISELSKTVVAALNEQRSQLEGHPAKIKEFANHYVLPYVDTEKMARYVMGRYWRTTSDEQKNAFVNEFTTTLMRSYSQSLLKLKINSVTVKPKVEEKPGRVTVSSEVEQADGNKTDVIYRAYLDKHTQKWLIYDVTVEGVSMLLNYRKTYDSEFGKNGVDAVIAAMKEKNKEFNGALDG